ncbi:MAG: hypothetical protein IKG85_02720 [Clostridia bacterium]|nr:hypothetical protein [Clostridia bacterium]
MKTIKRAAALLMAALCLAGAFACGGSLPEDHKEGMLPTGLPADTREPAAETPEPTEPAEETPAAPVLTEGPTAAPTEAPKPTPAPTEAPKPTAEPTAKPTKTPKPTAEPTAKPTKTPKPTAKPTSTPKPSGSGDQSVFDDAAFIGNSLFEGLWKFGIITHGRFFTKVGLNVNTVMTAHIEGSSVPVIDELNTGSYGKVILLFGENEIGWPSQSTFMRRYAELLDAIWERQPHAEIYVCGMPPVTKARSDRNENGLTNENIVRTNAKFKQMAQEKGAYYIGLPSAMYDNDGALPAEASSDGIHLNLKYDRIWAEYITRKVNGN